MPLPPPPLKTCLCALCRTVCAAHSFDFYRRIFVTRSWWAKGIQLKQTSTRSRTGQNRTHTYTKLIFTIHTNTHAHTLKISVYPSPHVLHSSPGFFFLCPIIPTFLLSPKQRWNTLIIMFWGDWWPLLLRNTFLLSDAVDYKLMSNFLCSIQLEAICKYSLSVFYRPS